MKKKVLYFGLSLVLVASSILFVQSKNKALLHDNLVRANYDALTQTEVITVLDLCIECPLAVCIYQYEFQGEIITEKPIDDFKKEE